MTIDSLHRSEARDDVSIAVVRAHAEYRLVLGEHVCVGTRLFAIEGDLTQLASRYSVQVGRNRHIDMPSGCGSEEILDRFFWRFTNHSCEPNAMVRDREMFALTCIDPWEQITFNYNTTEYDMAEPFDCRCGQPHCEGVIRGYRWLSTTSRQRIRHLVAGHLHTVDENQTPDVPAAGCATGRR